jgi:hypothetical protein
MCAVVQDRREVGVIHIVGPDFGVSRGIGASHAARMLSSPRLCRRAEQSGQHQSGECSFCPHIAPVGVDAR